MIRVPVQTFNRISRACGNEPERPFMQGVLVESTASGKVICTASDGKILACERTGFVTGVPASQTLIAPLYSEQSTECRHVSGDVVVIPGAACWVERDGMPVEFLQPLPYKYIDWRASALPKKAPKKPTVPVSFSARHIEKLLSTTPSGGIVFPEFIDVNSSVVVNDPDVPEWFGLFMPVLDGDKRNLQPAIIPGWFE